MGHRADTCRAPPYAPKGSRESLPAEAQKSPPTAQRLVAGGTPALALNTGGIGVVTGKVQMKWKFIPGSAGCSVGTGGHEGGQTYGACPKGWGSQAGCVDLGLWTSWENTGPGLEVPHVSIPVCSACPRLRWTPPCKLVLQSAALLTPCEAACAWPSLSPLALARPMHRWAGCGPVPRARAGSVSTCELAARGPDGAWPPRSPPAHPPRRVRSRARRTHTKRTSTHHALYTHTTHALRRYTHGT